MRFTVNNEEWRPVVGYEGLYEVSDHGRVRSLDHYTTNSRGVRRLWRGRVLKPRGAPGKSPYPRVNLSGGPGRVHEARVHSLVMAAFVGPLELGMHVRHLDGNPWNCHLSNLAYGTPSENAYDKVRHGRDHNAAKTHCIHGHELTAENLYLYSRADGGVFRCCKPCALARGAARTSRQREASSRGDVA